MLQLGFGKKFVRTSDEFAVYFLIPYVVNNRFIHLYGQPPARLDRLARLEPVNTSPPPSWIKIIIGIIYFNAHESHMASLEEIYIDRITYQSVWKSFIEERLREWHAVTILVRTAYFLFLIWHGKISNF